jgi:cyclopropane fatty-acyl-phospholipid synthase-like methyltransferase
MNELPKHLGGHKNKTHLDEATLDFIVEKYQVSTFLDIGCGPGGMVKLAKEKNLKATGIDGDWLVERDKTIQKNIVIHDYTTGSSPLNKKYDLVWSTEFLEHVDESFQNNYMKDFAKGKYALVTFAPPGKGGHHHVNCKPSSYWIEVFNDYGFTYDDETTKKIREISSMGTVKKRADGSYINKHRFVHENGLFFSSV